MHRKATGGPEGAFGSARVTEFTGRSFHRRNAKPVTECAIHGFLHCIYIAPPHCVGAAAVEKSFMAVLRVRCALVVLATALLGACSGSSEPKDDVLRLSGSVGDGPVVGALLRITDADGELLEEHESSDLADY